MSIAEYISTTPPVAGFLIMLGLLLVSIVILIAGIYVYRTMQRKKEANIRLGCLEIMMRNIRSVTLDETLDPKERLRLIREYMIENVLGIKQKTP